VRAARASALAGVVAALGLSGCGGGGIHGTAEQDRTGGEAAQREAAAKGVRTEDRVAYYQLATTAGVLRTEASLAERARSGTGTSSDGALRAGRTRLDALRPRDATLAGLRVPLAGAIDAFLRVPRGAGRRAASPAALASVAVIDAGLRRYFVGHSAEGALVPD
jgi:hypothetical protein